MAEGVNVMKRTEDIEEMVECKCGNMVSYITKKLFLRLCFGMQLGDKKFIRYKDGAFLYSMSQREFYKLAHNADAVYKLNKMALVNVEKVDSYLEYFRA